mmetsp:Transcript_1812/g.3219  ORF Transcript_1812/g.3219 Transcript_1812/m.3219 type:complete len:104 (+) Transcript_1812:184-495(+)
MEQYKWLSNCYQMHCDGDYVIICGEVAICTDQTANPNSHAAVYCKGLDHRLSPGQTSQCSTMQFGIGMDLFLKASGQYVLFVFTRTSNAPRINNGEVKTFFKQ